MVQRAKLCGPRRPDTHRRRPSAETPPPPAAGPRPDGPSLTSTIEARRGIPTPSLPLPVTLPHKPTQGQETGSPSYTWKKPGAMGPDAIASLGAMLPITGLGAAAALCRGGGDGKSQVRPLPVQVFPSLLKQLAPRNKEPKPSNYSDTGGFAGWGEAALREGRAAASVPTLAQQPDVLGGPRQGLCLLGEPVTLEVIRAQPG